MPNNTYTGGTVLSDGVLQIGADSTVSGGLLTAGPLGTGLLSLTGGTLQDDGLPRRPHRGQLRDGHGPVTLAVPPGLTFGPSTLGTLATPNTFTVAGGPAITVATRRYDQRPDPGDTLVVAGPDVLTITAAANAFTAPRRSRAARWRPPRPSLPDRSPWAAAT